MCRRDGTTTHGGRQIEIKIKMGVVVRFIPIEERSIHVTQTLTRQTLNNGTYPITLLAKVSATSLNEAVPD